MRELAETALAYAASQPKDLPGALGCVDDWLIGDSTTVRLHDRLKAVYPGAGDYAFQLQKNGPGMGLQRHLGLDREGSTNPLCLNREATKGEI